jgi:hypothetical protein
MPKNGCAVTMFLLIIFIIQAQTISANNCTAISDINNFTILTVAVYKETFAEAQKRLGPTEIFKVSGDRSVNMCYSFKTSEGQGVVVFSSNALGGWKTIHIFNIYKDIQRYPMRCKCSKLILKNEVETKGGLSFDTTKNDLENTFGVPKWSNSSRWRYYCCSKFEFCKDKGFGYSPDMMDAGCNTLQADRCYGINIYFKDDSIYRYELFSTESY